MCRLLPIPFLLVMLAGCFKPVEAPSLAPRPVEDQTVLPPGGAIEPQLPAPAGLQATLDAQVAAATSGDATFVTEQAAAARAIKAAHGAPPGGEAWTSAQQALTALEAALAPVRDAAAAVDALRHDPANAGSGARAAIEAAAQRIGGIQDRERASVAAASRSLS